MLPVADITTKDIRLKIKEEFAMKRLPRQLNVFFFFLSRYILSTKNTSVRRRYSKGHMIESTTDENFFSSDLRLAWISKNKLKALGVKSEDYLPWFERFTRLHSVKTMTRCERFRWKPEAHQFFNQFLDLNISEYEEFKFLLRTKKSVKSTSS